MSEIGSWLRFALAVLATWRITHLLACEDGPADIIVRLRMRLGESIAGKLMDCFNCLSLWVAIPFALLLTLNPVDLILIWPALSGSACLLERIGQDPVVVQPVTQGEEEANHGMLWSKKGGVQEGSEDEANLSTAQRK